MSVRNFLFTIVGCSIPIGVLAGVAVDPTMLPRAVHPWQKADRSPHITSASYESAENGPQDMNPWATDRIPTWKREKTSHETAFPPIDDGFDVPRHSEPTETEQAVSIEPASLSDAAQPARSAAIDAQAPVVMAQAAIEPHPEPETTTPPALNVE